MAITFCYVSLRHACNLLLTYIPQAAPAVHFHSLIDAYEIWLAAFRKKSQAQRIQFHPARKPKPSNISYNCSCVSKGAHLTGQLGFPHKAQYLADFSTELYQIWETTVFYKRQENPSLRNVFFPMSIILILFPTSIGVFASEVRLTSSQFPGSPLKPFSQTFIFLFPTCGTKVSANNCYWQFHEYIQKLRVNTSASSVVLV